MPPSHLHAITQAVYQRHAVAWDRHRSKRLFERGWLERFVNLVPVPGPVLDVGCGGGEPIARYLIEIGYELWGLDFAPAMLALARTRWPDQRWILGDMRSMELGREFPGVVAWDSYFHLSPHEQREMLPRFERHLAPGGALLLTMGHEAGEIEGVVEGEPVYHASLAPDEYEEGLAEVGMRVEAMGLEDPGCDYHSVLLAVKAPGPTPASSR